MSQKGRRITPPLPSWKPIAPTEKENEPNLDRNRESRTVGKHNCAVPSTSRRSHVSGRLSGATTSRVVRFGESVESLFFLIDESSGEHRKICNDIANGDKADDPPSWRRVLEVASTSALSTSASLISTGQKIIRLHRRATARFPVRFGDGYGKVKREHAKEILAIWLLYAQAQRRYGSSADAQHTYRHVMTSFKKEGEDDASLYLAVAEFELDEKNAGMKGIEVALEMIRMGIENGAEPMGDLNDRLRLLQKMKCKSILGSSSSQSSIPTLPLRPKKTTLILRSPISDKKKEGVIGSLDDRGQFTSILKKGQIQKKENNQLSEQSSDDDTGQITFKKASVAKPCGDGNNKLIQGEKKSKNVPTSMEVSRMSSRHKATLISTNDKTISPTHLILPLEPLSGNMVQGLTKDPKDMIPVAPRLAPKRENTESHCFNNNDFNNNGVEIMAESSMGSLYENDIRGKLLHEKNLGSCHEKTKKNIGDLALNSDDDTETVVNFRQNLNVKIQHEEFAQQESRDIKMGIEAENSSYNKRIIEHKEKAHGTSSHNFSPVVENVNGISDPNVLKLPLQPSSIHFLESETAVSKNGDTIDISKSESEKRETSLNKELKSSSMNAKTPAIVPRKKTSVLSSGSRTLLSRKRLGGGAMRVYSHANDVSISSREGNENESDESTINLTNKKSRQSNSTISIPSQKLKRTDLSYMLNWDPIVSRKKSQDTGDELNDSKDKGQSKCDSANLSKQPPSIGSKETGNKTAEDNLSGHTDYNPECGYQNRQYDITPMNEKKSTTPTSAQLLSPEYMTMVSTSNVDFLPLVCENNILRVNSIPYAKLGVIGKGGSCKVYRALSKECSVVAIKKVKLAGMDEKGINGYANEIALLKRLRGNAAIIQMYDSEVDLNRKAIFLVMEVGEVDLNYVLQQQALMDGKSKSGNRTAQRNMNFIRLTWQQMLSAVHCIHEERIIHGDLKPANFLFVRGTLKLIDFGIAKAIQSDDTTNIYRDSQIGTLNYMSPEAILDTGTGEHGAQMKCGKPSDVWALGCILYQMCYGRTPFAELHVIPKLQAIVNPNYKIKFPEIIDEAAIDSMQQCLNRTPEDRAPIIGKNGLLNEHWFLHSKRIHQHN